MNKLYILTAVTFTSFLFVQAQGNEDIRQPQRVNSAVQTIRQAVNQTRQEEAPRMQQLTTGDENIDSQVKALNKEMEDKIKAIRDEYVAKIKSLVGDKKIIRPVMMATTTPPGMYRGEKRGENEGNKTGNPIMMGSDIENKEGVEKKVEERPMLRDLIPKENSSQQNLPPRIINFFRGLFGGNN
jgi:hypothetical protein